MGRRGRRAEGGVIQSDKCSPSHIPCTVAGTQQCCGKNIHTWWPFLKLQKVQPRYNHSPDLGSRGAPWPVGGPRTCPTSARLYTDRITFLDPPVTEAGFLCKQMLLLKDLVCWMNPIGKHYTTDVHITWAWRPASCV
uniref:Uncharacterized protein n=1 Tax=Pipistrellus kuhlii TaxID=59472 RepID=A0A7J7VVA8_PIPKU|nr:hypothetical protein mPipKuh1_008293 [Pipistrellus kuhlii]